MKQKLEQLIEDLKELKRGSEAMEKEADMAGDVIRSCTAAGRRQAYAVAIQMMREVIISDATKNGIEVPVQENDPR